MQTLINIDPIFLFVMVDGGGGVRRSGLQSAPLEVPLAPNLCHVEVCGELAFLSVNLWAGLGTAEKRSRLLLVVVVPFAYTNY